MMYIYYECLLFVNSFQSLNICDWSSEEGRLGGSTHWLVHTDLCWDEELLHGHHVHVGEVLDHKPLALVQVVVTSTNAVVLLKVHNVLRNHDRVLDVRLNPLKALDTLVAGVLLKQHHKPLQSDKHGWLHPQSSAQQWQTACQHSILKGPPHTSPGPLQGLGSSWPRRSHGLGQLPS